MRFAAGALVVTAIALANPAVAADGAVTGPTPPPPQPPLPPLWSGIYFGPHVGYGLSSTVLSDTNFNISGALGGGQVGYNFLAGNAFLIGVEGDVTAADISKAINFPPAAGYSYESFSTNGFISLRARGGLPIGNLLLYGTAGAAWGHGDITPTGPVQLNAEAWHTGWVGGVGGEWAFSQNWSVRLEYLHYDLGNATYDGIGTGHFNADILRFGVNILFH